MLQLPESEESGYKGSVKISVNCEEWQKQGTIICNVTEIKINCHLSQF